MANFYMINMQKVLYIAKELHKKGYENLRVIPSMSPSGLYWRCSFVVKNNGRKLDVIASNWIQEFYEIKDKEIESTIQELTNSFIEKENEFLQKCKGKNEEYVKWYENMLTQLKKEELPYAFSDYFSAKDFWRTSLRNEIKTLSGEEQNYFGF